MGKTITSLLAIVLMSPWAALAVYPDMIPSADFDHVLRLVGTDANDDPLLLGSAVPISNRAVLSSKHLTNSTHFLKQNNITELFYTERHDHPSADLSIFCLREPLADFYEPLYLTDAQLPTKTVALVGYGLTGTKRASNSGYDITANSQGTLREGVNVIDRLVTMAGDGDTIEYTLQNQQIGGKDEGGISRGDSGGGWFIKQDNKWRVVGINQRGWDGTGNYVEGNLNTVADFGDFGRAINLAHYKTWIEENCPTPVPEPAGLAIAFVVGALLLKRRRILNCNRCGSVPHRWQ